ncbi:hypothetical protein [Gordonia sp. NPDC003376]
MGEKSGGDVTPLDGDDFLAANRRNRERHRDEAARKAARKARRGTAADPADDRVPGKITGPARRSRWSRPRIAGSWRLFVLVGGLIVAVVALAVSTAVLAVALHDARSTVAATPDDAARRSALDTAERYAVALTTYDSANYADLDRRIREMATPDFARTYIASSRDARAGNTQAKGTSSAVAEHAGIVSMTPDKAVVLVALDQTVTSPEIGKQVPDGIPYQSRVQLTLAKRDGEWRLDDLSTV